MKSFKKEKGKMLTRIVLSPDMRVVFHEKTDPILTSMFVDATERFKKEQEVKKHVDGIFLGK